MAKLFGTNQPEYIESAADGDELLGWDAANAQGNEGPVNDHDTLYTAYRDVTLRGGAGNDFLSGTGINASLYGGAGDDQIEFFFPGAMANGGSGADLLISLASRATAAIALTLANPSVMQEIAGLGRFINMDRLDLGGTRWNDAVTGGDLADKIDGRDGNDTIHGGAGNDSLAGGVGLDLIYGGRGDDLIAMNNFGSLPPGADTIGGGDGLDTLQIQVWAEKVALDFTLMAPGETSVLVGRFEMDGVERIDFTLSDLDDTVRGGAFNDMIDGRGGADSLVGGLGNDTLYGGDGATLVGDRGDDEISVLIRGQGQVEAYGLDGVDLLTLTIESGTQGLRLDMADVASYTAVAGVGRLGRFEQLALYGGFRADTVIGGALDDTLYGNDGNDNLTGGAGDDVLRGWFGADSLYGGAGDDLIEDRNGRDKDLLFGGSGNDSLNGWNGSDFLYGGAGNDVLVGRDGFDLLNGGPGSDTMTGGAWADKFDFNAAPVAGEVDVITDFEVARDKIRLVGSVFGDLAAGRLAAAAFAAGTVAGDASDRVIYDQATGRVWFDGDGNGAAAAVLFLTVNTDLTLTASDFAVL